MNGPRLRTLWLYMTRQVGALFFLALITTLSVLSLERLLRIIDMVTAAGAPFNHVFVLMFYLIPHYLELAIPFAYLVATLWVFRRLQENSELSVVQSVGLSLRVLLQPVMVQAAFLVVVLLLLSGFWDPHARYQYRAAVYSLTASGQLLSIQPGMFTPVGDNIIVRADKVERDGRLKNVFFTDYNRNTGDRHYANAPTGRIDHDPVTGQVTLVLENGNMVRDDGVELSGALEYKEYPWQMPDNSGQVYGSRGRNEREMTFPELMRGHVGDVIPQSTAAKEKTEFQARLVQALSLPLLGILSLPLALLGSGRTGRAYGIVAGIAIFILYDKILGFAQAAASKGHLSPYPALWGPWLLLVATTWAFLHWKTPRRLRVRPVVATA